MSKNKKQIKRIEGLLNELVQAANKSSLATKEISRRLEQIERSLSRLENAKASASSDEAGENEKIASSPSQLIAHRY